MGEDLTVWVFVGNARRSSGFPSAIFTRLDLAEEWIQKNAVSGVLTQYPVNISVYDWSITKGYFLPKKEHEATPTFVGTFTSASQTHYHYEDGQRPSVRDTIDGQ